MIRCPNCGTHMEENEVKCPLCGEPVAKENSNFFSNQNPPSPNDSLFSSPKIDTTSFLSSSPKEEKYTKKVFFENQPESPAPSSDKKQIYLILIIIVVIIAIIIGIIFVMQPKDKNTSTTDDINKIELNEVDADKEEEEENNNSPEEPSSPENPPEDDPETPATEEPETPKQVTIGSYVITIPDDYNVTQDSDNTATLGNADTGAIITIEAGKYSIQKYRANDSELKKSYESQQATVERIYDDKITNHDVHILEVDQEGTKFLIAITPSVNNRSYILTIFNGYQKEAYDYGSLTQALAICDNIKLSS